MTPKSFVKDTLVIGGFTLFGFVAGGKLGSMFGAVIGTVVCSLLNIEEPSIPGPSDIPTHPTYIRAINKRINSKHQVEKSKDKPCEFPKCSICLERFKPSIVILPCSHMCFCDDCYDTVRKEKVSSCPICRENIEGFMTVYS